VDVLDPLVVREEGPGGPFRAWTRRRWLVVGGVPVLVLACGSALLLAGGDGRGTASASGPAETSTAEVVAQDLVVTDEYEGELGHGDPTEVASGRSGVVTEVAEVGSTVTEGQALFSVDLQPTILLEGSVPAFRDLSSDSDPGADVAQLEQALVDLGYGDGISVDETFDSATASAVEAWESDLGRTDPDGTVELGDVAFGGSGVRVSTITADAGTQVQSGGVVVEVTSSTKVVTLDLAVDAADGLEGGTVVNLELPNGEATTGTVFVVGAEEEAEDDPSAAGAAGGGGGPTVPVTILLDEPDLAEAIDSGTVDVSLERSRVDGANAVPVTALLALAEGGYAVEVVDDSPDGSHLVAVDVGTFADDLVQVTGEGIEPGVVVVVPA
jgi:peptidoglycan hydrolase-like protein with peptidoglycan-binding domain